MNTVTVQSRLTESGMRQDVAGELVMYLFAANDLDRPDLLQGYLRWRRGVDEARAAESALDKDLQCARSVLGREEFPLSPALSRTIEALASESWSSVDTATGADDGHRFDSLRKDYTRLVLEGERRKAMELILDQVERGEIGIEDLYRLVFTPALEEVGRQWESNRLSVGQEHYFTAVTQAIMSQLYPRIFAAGERRELTMVAASAPGNLHEIGVRMVADMFELSGWDTCYLGADTPARDIVDTVKRESANVLCLSAMLTWQVSSIKVVIEALRDDSEVAGVPVIIGGRAFRTLDRAWDLVGANGYAVSPTNAIDLAGKLASGHQ